MKATAQLTVLKLSLLLPAVLLLQAIAAEPKPEALTAPQVLERLAKAYSTAQTYRDTGVVKTVFVEAEGRRTVERSFTTVFIRPDRIRFDYVDKLVSGKERHYIVWAQAGNIQTWWDVTPGIRKPKTIGKALAGAGNVSGGAAQTVPALLLPNEVSGLSLTDLMDPKRLEDAKAGPADCFRIQGKSGKSPTTLWIDQSSFLLRRIDTEEKFDKFRTETTTTYEAELNKEIPDKLLHFNPSRL